MGLQISNTFWNRNEMVTFLGHAARYGTDLRFASVLAAIALLAAGNTAVGGELPRWIHLSSRSGDLPPPGTSTQQTACLVLDIDKDGLNDIVIGSRSTGARLVWYRRGPTGWTIYPIDACGLQIEAGGACADIDRDGDLDLVFGEDWSGSKLYWWENPYPHYDLGTSWPRREIKRVGGQMHHDQIFGDFDGDGRPELAFWVQRFQGLLHVEIPTDPRGSGPWRTTRILALEDQRPLEGLAKADVDSDGKIDLIGGGRWFKHRGGARFDPMVIAGEFRASRAAAGQLVTGGAPEVVFVVGDGVGRLKWFERRQSGWAGHDLLGEDVIHGHTLELGDINCDGHLDIFCAEMSKWTDSALAPDHANARMWVFYGDGQGTFIKSLAATCVDNHESRVADLDGDGDLDIVGKPYNWDAPRLDIWLNGGTGPRRTDSAAERGLLPKTLGHRAFESPAR
jgi:hypothetical protein